MGKKKIPSEFFILLFFLVCGKAKKKSKENLVLRKKILFSFSANKKLKEFSSAVFCCL